MKRYQLIKASYNNFINNNIIDSTVRKEISESWIRCKDLNIDPLSGKGQKLPTIDIDEKLKQNSELINVAKPIMENMYKVVAGSSFSILLTDKDGFILDVIGDENIMKKADALNFIKGTLWSEEAVGTNAIGTSIYLDKPLQTMGPEHYCIKHHSWSCSATTIHNENGEIIGCLNMSGSYTGAHPHTLGMVLTGAYSIENQLALIKSNKLINATFQSITDGMLIIGRDLNIIRANAKAFETLGYESSDLIHRNIKDIIKETDFLNKIIFHSNSYYDLDCDFYDFKDNLIKCTINAVPISTLGTNSSILITFRTSQVVNKFLNKVIGFPAIYRFQDIITRSNHIKSTIEYAKKAALSQCNVLIQGASGTGKELFAQSIHNYSERSKEPFVAINCASIPKELMESELFGYENGAFTGASKDGHMGKFELAEGGTIFLDEIGEMPLDMQSKLLRVLDNKKICRIGGTYEKKLNVRIITATNRNLFNEVNEKNFREDLYYRLNVMNINIIPLKDRPEDIELLSNHFINKLNKGQLTQKSLNEISIKKLTNHSWPGNVRELQNVVERSYYLCDEKIITEKYIIIDNSKYIKETPDSNSAHLSLEDLEKRFFIEELIRCDFQIKTCCENLNLSKATLYRRINKYNISLKELKSLH